MYLKLELRASVGEVMECLNASTPHPHPHSFFVLWTVFTKSLVNLHFSPHFWDNIWAFCNNFSCLFLLITLAKISASWILNRQGRGGPHKTCLYPSCSAFASIIHHVRSYSGYDYSTQLFPIYFLPSYCWIKNSNQALEVGHWRPFW